MTTREKIEEILDQEIDEDSDGNTTDRILELVEQERQNNKVEIQETLLAYTDFLEKWGYVDADVWAETPSALNRFLSTLTKKGS